MKKNYFKLAAVGVLFLVIGWVIWAQVAAHQKIAVSKDGVPISYSVYGKGEPALIFVHGWCADRYTWYNQVPYFDKKHKVVALDLAGHGSSGRQRQVYTQEAFGEDVAAVVRAVGCRKAILIGHSMSGTVILEANRLLKGTVAGLIAIDTLENFERIATPEEMHLYIDPIRADFVKGTSAFVRVMFPKNADPKLVDRVVAKVSSAEPAIAINALEYYFKTPVIPLLSGVNVPLWCLNTDLWPSSPEINRKYLKSYNLRIMPGLGHFLMLEAPDEFNRQLEDIIQKIKA